jgi:hypothetical protein
VVAVVDLEDERVVAGAVVLAIVLVGVLVTGVAGVSLSITGRAVLLVALLVGLVATGIAYRTLPSLGMLAVALAFLTGVYVASTWGTSLPVAAVVAIVLMSVVVGIVYRIQEGGFAVPRRTITVALAVLVVLSVGTVGVDLAVGGVDYDVDIYGSVVFSADRTYTVGAVTATSTSFLREPIDYPSVEVCMYLGDGRQRLGYVYEGESGYFPTSVPGNSNTTSDINVILTQSQRDAVPNQLELERATSCPANRTDPGIVVAVPGSVSG